MTGHQEQFLSIFFVLGVLVIVVYAWKQFNEPSFPNQATLPRTVDPLRYLFLKSAYRRARLTYVAVLALLYCLLVWPGPAIVPLFGKVGEHDFPAQGWALLVALALVGFVPNSNVKWLTTIEEALRRSVHAWFLVPDGVLSTIAVLDDTGYEPPPNQLDAVPSPLREELLHDLRLPEHTLQYSWARARMLMFSLHQMGSGARNPLLRASFDPFQQDFDEMQTSFTALELEIGQFKTDPKNSKGEPYLIRRVGTMLKRIYAYISWGVRNQAKTESDIDQILMALGFQIPPTGGQRLIEIVVPAVGLVGAIAFAYWSIFYAVQYFGQQPSMSDIVTPALVSGIVAALMYGGAITIALKQRANQIDQGRWREGSWACLFPIALRAGLVTWSVIAVSMIFTQLTVIEYSLAALPDFVGSTAGADRADLLARLEVFPYLLFATLPWFFAGAAVSFLLARSVGRQIVRRSTADRVREAIRFGLVLGVVATSASFIQNGLNDNKLVWNATNEIAAGQASLNHTPATPPQGSPNDTHASVTGLERSIPLCVIHSPVLASVRGRRKAAT
jgi:hypothetical protein